MPKIYQYQKDLGALALPALKADEDLRELCTVNGVTYVAASDTVVFPKQTDTIRFAPVDGATLGEKLPQVVQVIEQALPATADINAQVVARIRARYSADDEIKMLRTAPSPESALWNDYVEECLAWGRTEKAKMGLAKQIVVEVVAVEK